MRQFLAARQPAHAGAAPAVSLAEARVRGLAQEGRIRATASAFAARPAVANLSAAWTALGPVAVASSTFGNVTGRITALALDPNDASGNTLYVGTTGGGVWKSTNAAGTLTSATFTPLTDTLSVFSVNAGSDTPASLSIGALAVQPMANPVLMAGTGDPNDALDSYYGEGLLRSADGGVTWTLIDISEDGANGNHSLRGMATAGLAWSSTTPTTVVAAFSTSTEGGLVDAAESNSTPGLYYSTDAGVTWQMATIYDGSQIVQTPTPLGTSQAANPVTAVVWNAARQAFFAAVRSHGYYSSTDGIHWYRLTNQPGTGLTTANCPVGVNGAGSANCPILRGALAVQPATGDLYALTVDANLTDQGIWQDLCNLSNAGGCSDAAPTFSHRVDAGQLETGYGTTGGSTAIAEGDYNLTLAALPATSGNGTLLFAGTVDLYRCALSYDQTACSTLRNTTNALNGCNAPAGVAPSEHALAGLALGSAGPLLYLGNDGGLWRSTDGVAETGTTCATTDASHFNNLNGAIAAGGSLAEIVGFAESPTDAGTLLAGLAENGSAGTASGTQLTAWPQLSAGEGGQPLIDPNTPANWYVTIGEGVNLKFCSKGSACTVADFASPATVGATQTDADASLVHVPALLDPGATTSLLVATCRVWRGPAENGSAWSTGNALSPTPVPTATTGSTTTCATTAPILRSLGAGGPAANAGNAGSTVLYAGESGPEDGGESYPGHIFANTAANTASAATPWTDLALNPVTNDSNDGGIFNPAGFEISSIAVDPHDATGATVYASVMGFSITTYAPRLYRSTDFGAHWLNVTSNLPDVPANSVLVDPNDANTVYLALDTGVYVTTAITTCATADCWSPLGTGLPNSPVTQLQAGTQLLTGDGREGMLRASTYGRGLWQTPLLSAVSLAAPGLSANPTSLTFPSTQAQTLSAAQTVTLTSNGSSAVTISTLAITGDYTETDNCAGQTLNVGSTCTVSVVFAPTASGTRTGQLTVYANISGGQVTVALSGTGTAAASVVLTPTSLSFPATAVSATSATEIVTVSNTGGTTATLGTPTLGGANPGDFSVVANTCMASLASQVGCSVGIAFKPTASGTRTATLTIVTSAGTVTATLSGTGQAPATDTLAPTSLTFAATAIGTTSAAQTVTMTNAGDVALTLITATTTGDFAATNTCGASLPAHSSCAFSVTFSPTTVGARTGVLTITDQYHFQTVPLNGTGVSPAGISLTPTSMGFGTLAVGSTSSAQVATLANNGGSALALGKPAVTGDFAIAANSCGSSLAAGQSCTISIVFAPTAAGARTGTVTLTDSAVPASLAINLSGTGFDFTLAADGQTTVTVASGTTASFPMLLSSVAGLSGTVTTACSGNPAHTVCTIAPAAPVLGGTTTVTATVQTGTAALGWPFRFPLQDPRLLFACALIAIPLASLRRRRLPWLALLFCLSLPLLGGCGTGRIIPGTGDSSTGGSGGGTTASGTYTITVTASANGVSHALNFTLVVQ